MTIAKKAVTEFRVPRLDEVSPEYAELLAKRAGLLEKQASLNSSRKDLERQIAALPASSTDRMSPNVAALLGEQPDSRPILTKTLAEVRSTMGEVEAALEIVRRRLGEGLGEASRAACAAVRPEYERRLSEFCQLLEKLDVARQSHDDLLDALALRKVHCGRCNRISSAIVATEEYPIL
jgi:chromosome segregation ATPase